jgi:hypothetical protein
VSLKVTFEELEKIDVQEMRGLLEVSDLESTK